MSHTPGPWVADNKENCGSDGKWGVWHVESCGPICWVGDPYPRGVNHPYENMLLIAAAPLLLEAAETALFELVAFLSEETCDHEVGICFCNGNAAALALRTAINAAKGNQ